MDETVNQKITNFKNYCKSISDNPQVKLLIDVLDNDSLYKMFDELYLKLNLTKEQAYAELTEKLQINPDDEQKQKLERYIEYFYEILKVKYENQSYDDLLKSIS